MAYGLEVFGPNGTSVVFSSSTRVCNIAVLATTAFGANGGGSDSVTYDCDSANDTSKVIISVGATGGNLQVSSQYYSLTRTATNFTVTNLRNVAETYEVLAYRIA